MVRFFDIFFASFILISLLPLLLPITVVLSLTGERHIFYKQKRIGKNNRVFYVLKFATMKKDSPTMGAGTITLKDDPRVLPVGRFLRASKINEVPQLWNIIVGDMSFIGPRPLTEDNFRLYSEDAQKIISSITPGLSGVGSIIFRGEDKLLLDKSNARDIYSELISPYKEELELWYANKRNIFLYFGLILLTVIVVLKPGTKIMFRIFKDLPKPPVGLKF